jgi:DNA mismatch repair ATPase MutS
MHTPLLQLYSSMRNADDINSHSSYFYAELSRLKKVMDGIENSKGQIYYKFTI